MTRTFSRLLTFFALLGSVTAYGDTFRYDFSPTYYTQIVPVPESTVATFTFLSPALFSPSNPNTSACGNRQSCIDFTTALCSMGQSYLCTVEITYDPGLLYPTGLLLLPLPGTGVTTALSTNTTFTPSDFTVGHHESEILILGEGHPPLVEPQTLDITDLSEATVPEPSTAVLIGTGVLIAALQMRPLRPARGHTHNNR